MVTSLVDLPAVPGPPPPPARPPFRFDAPFTLLDDDIDDVGVREGELAASTIASEQASTRRVESKLARSPLGGVDAIRRSERQQRRVCGKLLEAPPTPLSADAVVPSSLPSSPVSFDSSAPTALNSPASHTAATGGRLLLDELSLLVQRQQPQDEDGGNVARATDSRARKGTTRGKMKRSKKTSDDNSEKRGSKQRRATSRTAGKTSQQTSSTYIDTTNASDIRVFLAAAKVSRHVSDSSVLVDTGAASSTAGKMESVAEDVTLSAPPSPAATPPRPSLAPLSALYTPSLIRSPHVDVEAMRRKFGLERNQAGHSTRRATATIEGALSQHVEREDDHVQQSISHESSSSERAEALSGRAGKRKRAAAASGASSRATAATVNGGVLTENSASMRAERMVVEEQPLRSSSTMPFSPTSPLLPLSTFVPIRSDLSRHPTLTDELLEQQRISATAAHVGIIIDDSMGQRLERASTIIVHNTADDLPLVRPTPLHPAVAAAQLTRQQPRQASLISTTSSTSTASADASTRLPSTDSASSSPPALAPCERLPSTFPGFQCERLTARTGPYTVRCFAATTTGSIREKNQDAFAIMTSQFGRSTAVEDSVCIMSVFDGHGALGHTASRLCAATMPLQVAALIAAEPTADEVKDSAGAHASIQCIQHRLGCLRQSFDACQQLLLDVARAEQEYIAALLSKLQPDMNFTATRVCQSVRPSHRLSPPSSPALFIPQPPSLSNMAAVYESTPLLTHADMVDLPIPPLVPSRKLEARPDGDGNNGHDAHGMPLLTDQPVQPGVGSDPIVPQAEVAAAGGRPVVERKKKKRRRRPLGKPRKRASPMPQDTQRQHNMQVDSVDERAVTGISDSERDEERKELSDDASLSIDSLQPIQRSPVKRAPIKPTHSRASPRLKPTTRSSDTAAPVAIDVDYGTTGLVVVVEGADVYVANAGDSRCVILEWGAGGDPTNRVADGREGETKEVPAALRSPRSSPRARSPPSVAARTRVGSIVSRSHSSPFASFSSGTIPPASSITSSASFWRTVFVSGDHDPSLTTALGVSEYERVRCEGGSVLQLPSQYRVYPDTLTVAEAKSRALTLNMSRALGHQMLSQHGVTHTPDCTHIQLTHCKHEEGLKQSMDEQERVADEEMRNDNTSSSTASESEVWLLLASDGVWDVMDVDAVREAIDLQRQHQSSSGHGDGSGVNRDSSTITGCKGVQGNGVCLECVCCSLLQSCEAAWQTRGGDNITIVLTQLTVTSRAQS